MFGAVVSRADAPSSEVTSSERQLRSFVAIGPFFLPHFTLMFSAGLLPSDNAVILHGMFAFLHMKVWTDGQHKVT